MVIQYCSINKAVLICFVTFLTGFSNASNPRNNMITINGGWSPWSTVATPCMRKIDGVYQNVTCGGGEMTRRRSCTNPEPQVMLYFGGSERNKKYLK